MKSQQVVVAASFIAGLALAVATPVAGQGSLAPGDQRIEGMEWNIRNLRPSGMPVIPMFDGWIDKGDGTADLCFGYFNLNLSETVDIPIGPENFVEPAQYNGAQPTHFREVPPGYRRYFCVWSVNVPLGTEPVVWTLGRNFRTYSTPGHTNSEEYVLENLFQPSRNALAPALRFIEPVQGPVARGRGIVAPPAGPAQARAGVPLTVAVDATQPEEPGYTGDPKRYRIYWHKFSGPAGDVTFEVPELPEEPEEPAAGGPAAAGGAGGGGDDDGPNNNHRAFASGATMTLPEGETVARLAVTFDEPGEYKLMVQGFDGSFGMQCCWTTAYLTVNVAP